MRTDGAGTVEVRISADRTSCPSRQLLKEAQVPLPYGSRRGLPR